MSDMGEFDTYFRNKGYMKGGDQFRGIPTSYNSVNGVVVTDGYRVTCIISNSHVDHVGMIHFNTGAACEIGN